MWLQSAPRLNDIIPRQWELSVKLDTDVKMRKWEFFFFFFKYPTCCSWSVSQFIDDLNVPVSVDLTRSIKCDAEQVEHVQYSFFLRLRWHFPALLLLRHQDVGIIIIEMLKTFRHHNHTWVLKVKNLKPIMFGYEHEALSQKRCRQNEFNLSRLDKCYLT